MLSVKEVGGRGVEKGDGEEYEEEGKERGERRRRKGRVQ